MTDLKTFPHYTVEYEDRTVRDVFIPEELPLHRPLFLIMAEKGKVGVPVWGDYTDMKAEFGEATFDKYSAFFKHSTLFAKEAMKYQKVFCVRVADADASAATLVLEAQVTVNADIPQYEKDGDGFRQVDVNGDWIPSEDPPGTPVTETGIEIVWVARALAEGETVATLAPTSDGDTTSYPILALEVDSPGARANYYGIKMWFDHGELDTDLVTDLGAMMFNFAAVQQPYGYDTTVPIRDFYNNTSVEFMFKPDQVNPSTDERISFDDVMLNNYDDDLPFTPTVFADNIKTIGDLIVTLDAVHSPELVDGWMANPMTGRNSLGQYYDHVLVNTTGVEGATIMDEDVIQYMTGGADGLTDYTTFDGLVKIWFDPATFPDITDEARYPITHMYDSGYTLDTKKAMIDFFGVRPDVKVVASTQDAANDPNTKAEDQSTGSALRAQMLLHPASTVYGTQAFRGTIIQQCGRLVSSIDAPSSDVVPLVFDCLQKKCKYQGSIRFKGKPKGLPNSAVTAFATVNWLPNSDDHKQLSWDTGLNYLQHYDMTSWHYPDVKSVYPIDQSTMSDDILADQLVYLYHIGRQSWAYWVGRDEPAVNLYSLIREDILKRIDDAFGTYLSCDVDVYQTDADKALGYKTTVKITVNSVFSQRVWDILIPVERLEE